MAMRFNIDGTNGQMCFVTHTSAKYQNTKEALQNRALSQVMCSKFSQIRDFMLHTITHSNLWISYNVKFCDL